MWWPSKEKMKSNRWHEKQNQEECNMLNFIQIINPSLSFVNKIYGGIENTELGGEM